ncbi:MAG TPA: polysaccharide biosynthesis protein, partial [Syntrophomonadaceae bacterium]|nr:polysaccharide biosynthesis protein [Syntrophomonadaceae bacterium]
MRKFSQRTFYLLAVDAALMIAAFYIALILRFDGEVPLQFLGALLYLIPFIVTVNLGFLLAFKLYGRVWEYASWE